MKLACLKECYGSVVQIATKALQILKKKMLFNSKFFIILMCHSISYRYVPPLRPATSRWSLELPDNPQALQEELSKQESLLNQLHEELAAGKADTEKEEQIWEVQRVCTQLKRKVKACSCWNFVSLANQAYA